jgi:hypothetical protein
MEDVYKSITIKEKEHQEIKTKGENIETRDGSKK